jgi:hypothetical protein
MPKPVYILCSESGSEDRITSLLSHFKVLEQMEVRELPKPPPGHPIAVSSFSFQIVAVWARSDEDAPDQEYESSTSIFLPPGDEEIVVASGRFQFLGSKRRYRSIVNVSGVIIAASGLFRAVDKVRPVGADNQPWLVQAYEVSVEHVKSGAEGAIHRPNHDPCP